MNRSESKYFNTAFRMDEALLRLLEKKPFAYITIKEICEEAQVNRSTFYLHYENTSDLLHEAIHYLFDRFFSQFPIDSHAAAARIHDAPLDELMFITADYLIPYLTYIKENRRICKAALEHPKSFDTGNMYQWMFSHVFAPVLERFHISEKEQRYMMRFYLTGITAIAMEWLEKDCEDSIEEICRIIIRCIMDKRTLPQE